MAGEASLEPIDIPVAAGEGQGLFNRKHAGRVENLVPDPDGSLASVIGPAPLAPAVGQGGPQLIGRPHGIFSVKLLGSTVQLVLLHAGNTLYRFRGWLATAPWDVLVTGLSDEDSARAPDVFIAFGDYVVWSNGVDRARVILADGQTFPLGFDRAPSAPLVDGPEMPSEGERQLYYPNSYGYSWQGDIGTEGEVLSSGQGRLLNSRRYYVQQYIDGIGNFSPLSARSEPHVVHSIQARGYWVDADEIAGQARLHPAELDELKRAALVRTSGDGPPHAVKSRLGRTKDVKREGPEAYKIVDIPGRAEALYHDEAEDGKLVVPMSDYVSVPVFSIAWVHNGKLFIAGIAADVSIVRASLPRKAGTFPIDAWCMPSEQGAAVTAGVSHAGRNYAFTRRAMYDITDMAHPVQVAGAAGCEAPASIQVLEDGTLVWRGPNGFMAMAAAVKANEVSIPVAISTANREVYDYELNHIRSIGSTAVYDRRYRQYLCAVTEAGKVANGLILAWHPEHGWSRYRYGFNVYGLCSLDDANSYVMAAVRHGSTNLVVVLYHDAYGYTAPQRFSIYKSPWVSVGDSGKTPFRARTLLLGLVDDSTDGISVLCYRNFDTADDGGSRPLEPYGLPLGPATSSLEKVAEAVIGEARLRRQRLYWRQVTVDLDDCTAFRFELRAEWPAAYRIGASTLLVDLISRGSVELGRVPYSDDRA